MVFDFDDKGIAKGRIGLWARDDSEARFDNVTITKLTGVAGAAASPSPSSLPSLPH
jgi:hypothetical protein